MEAEITGQIDRPIGYAGACHSNGRTSLVILSVPVRHHHIEAVYGATQEYHHHAWWPLTIGVGALFWCAVGQRCISVGALFAGRHYRTAGQADRNHDGAAACQGCVANEFSTVHLVS